MSKKNEIDSVLVNLIFFNLKLEMYFNFLDKYL
jgi:hypothetical protein